MKRFLHIVLVLLAVTALAACARQPVDSSQITGDPGFLYGLFHGFTIFFAFIGSFFTDYEIYAYPNSGWPYNLGYLIGVMIFFSGSGRASK